MPQMHASMDRDPAARTQRSAAKSGGSRAPLGCPRSPFGFAEPSRGNEAPDETGAGRAWNCTRVSTPRPTSAQSAASGHDTGDDQHDHDSDGAAGNGFDDRDLVDITAAEVISRAAVMLMSASAEQLGLASEDPGDPQHRDLDEARTLITALAGLLQASLPDLGPHAAAFRDGLQALQGAFREYSIVPDAPGAGPGETPRRPPAASESQARSAG